MSEQAYYALDPDTVLTAVESCGLEVDGSLLSLNSYENRVYRIHDRDSVPWVVKFYRPGRWSDEAILEEHEFARELYDHEIPVIAPSSLSNGATLHFWQNFRFTLFPCVGGREPNLENPDHLTQLGRYLGRIHQVGSAKPFLHRPHITLQTYGEDSIKTIMDSPYLPSHVVPAYEAVTSQIMIILTQQFEQHSNPEWAIRLHADFHPGNILWGQSGPHLVDLDDARMGPAVQDLWMLIGSDQDQQCLRFDDIYHGYQEFADFPLAQLHLLEPMRTLRILNYSAWLVRRWEDPSFQHHFPWFAEVKYWEEQILMLKEQLSVLQNDTTHQRLSSYL